MTYRLAHAAATDAGNRSMRAGGRTSWNEDDYNAAAREFDRLWPMQNPFRSNPKKIGSDLSSDLGAIAKTAVKAKLAPWTLIPNSKKGPTAKQVKVIHAAVFGRTKPTPEQLKAVNDAIRSAYRSNPSGYAQLAAILESHYGVGLLAAPVEAVLWAAGRLADTAGLKVARAQLSAANRRRDQQGKMPAYPEYGDRLFDRKRNRKKRNPSGRTAEQAYREFHGRDAGEEIEFDAPYGSKASMLPRTTSAIGDLLKLVIRVPKSRRLRGPQYVTVSRFGKCWLTENPHMKQLYAEGGDQAVDLEDFGLDEKEPHEWEFLGELMQCEYFTTKDHLGSEGGTARYHHKFGKNELTLSKTELIQVAYHVPDEELWFIGGGYTIPAEGIDG